MAQEIFLKKGEGFTFSGFYDLDRDFIRQKFDGGFTGAQALTAQLRRAHGNSCYRYRTGGDRTV